MTKTLEDYDKEYMRCNDAEQVLEAEIDRLKADLRKAEKASTRAWNMLQAARKREATVQPGANCASAVETSP